MMDIHFSSVRLLPRWTRSRCFVAAPVHLNRLSVFRDGDSFDNCSAPLPVNRRYHQHLKFTPLNARQQLRSCRGLAALASIRTVSAKKGSVTTTKRASLLSDQHTYHTAQHIRLAEAPTIARKDKEEGDEVAPHLPKTILDYLMSFGLPRQDAQRIAAACLARASSRQAFKTDIHMLAALKQTAGDWSQAPASHQAPVIRTADNSLQWLLDVGVAASHLPKLLRRYPRVLIVDPGSDFEPKVHWMVQQGASVRAVSKMIRACPDWLLLTMSELQAALKRVNLICRVPDFKRTKRTEVVASCPKALLMSDKELREAVRAVARIVGSPSLAKHVIRKNPQLLVTDVAANFALITAELQKYGLKERDVQALCNSQADLLISPATMEYIPILECFSQLGCKGEDLVEVLMMSPGLLSRDAAAVCKRVELLQRYRVNAASSIVTLGSRLAFLDERQDESLRTHNLSKLLKGTDEQFARDICGRLPEEFAVFKMQWETTHGMGLGWGSSTLNKSQGNPEASPAAPERERAAVDEGNAEDAEEQLSRRAMRPKRHVRHKSRRQTPGHLRKQQ